MGKATGRPLCQLLGGRLRTEIPFAAYVFYRHRSPDGRGGETTPGGDRRAHPRPGRPLRLSVDQAQGRRAAARGRVRGDGGPARGVPRHKLRFDPNALWSVETAIRLGARFEAPGPRVLRGPGVGDRGHEPGAPRRRIPFATNMCVTNFDQLPVGIRTGAIDVLLGDCQEWGGILATKKARTPARCSRSASTSTRGGECGVSTAAYLHIAASLPVLPYALDSHYHHQTADVITDRTCTRTGASRSPRSRGWASSSTRTGSRSWRRSTAATATSSSTHTTKSSGETRRSRASGRPPPDHGARWLDHPEGVCWSPPEEALYAGGEAGQVYRFALRGSGRRVGHQGGRRLHARSGARRRRGDLLCDAAHGCVQRISPDGRVERYGEAIASPTTRCSMPRPAVGVGLRRLGQDGGAIVRIDPDGGYRTGPRWSSLRERPGDLTAMAVRGRVGWPRVIRMPLDGGAPETVVDSSASSPTGSRSTPKGVVDRLLAAEPHLPPDPRRTLRRSSTTGPASTS